MNIAKGDSQGATQGKKERLKKDKDVHSIQCYECSGFRHVKTDCPNFVYTKGKSINASLIDEFESDDSEDSKEENASLKAFSDSLESAHGPNDCDSSIHVVTCDESSQGVLDEDINLQEAYNQLFKKLNEVEIVKKSLCVKLHDLNVVNDCLRNENSMLVNKVKSLEDNLVCKSNEKHS